MMDSDSGSKSARSDFDFELDHEDGSSWKQVLLPHEALLLGNRVRLRSECECFDVHSNSNEEEEDDGIVRFDSNEHEDDMIRLRNRFEGDGSNRRKASQPTLRLRAHLDSNRTFSSDSNRRLPRPPSPLLPLHQYDHVGCDSKRSNSISNFFSLSLLYVIFLFCLLLFFCSNAEGCEYEKCIESRPNLFKLSCTQYVHSIECLRTQRKPCHGQLHYHTIRTLVEKEYGRQCSRHSRFGSAPAHHSNRDLSSIPVRSGDSKPPASQQFQGSNSNTKSHSSSNRRGSGAGSKPEYLQYCLTAAYNYTIGTEVVARKFSSVPEVHLPEKGFHRRLPRMTFDLSPSSALKANPSLLSESARSSSSNVPESSVVVAQPPPQPMTPSMTCIIFGDPHLRTFDSRYQTCNCVGARPLIIHPLFTVQITNSRIHEQFNATGVTKLTLQVASFPHCGLHRELIYETDSLVQTQPSPTFTDGSTMNTLVWIQQIMLGQGVAIHLEHIGVRIYISQFKATKFLNVIIKFQTATSTVKQGAVLDAISDLSLCKSGCRPVEMVQIEHELERADIDWKSGDSNTASNSNQNLYSSEEDDDGGYNGAKRYEYDGDEEDQDQEEGGEDDDEEEEEEEVYGEPEEYDRDEGDEEEEDGDGDEEDNSELTYGPRLRARMRKDVQTEAKRRRNKQNNRKRNRDRKRTRNRNRTQSSATFTTTTTTTTTSTTTSTTRRPSNRKRIESSAVIQQSGSIADLFRAFNSNTRPGSSLAIEPPSSATSSSSASGGSASGGGTSGSNCPPSLIGFYRQSCLYDTLVKGQTTGEPHKFASSFDEPRSVFINFTSSSGASSSSNSNPNYIRSPVPSSSTALTVSASNLVNFVIVSTTTTLLLSFHAGYG